MRYIRTKDKVCVYDKAIQNIKSYWKTTLLSKYKINKYIKADIEILNKAIITQAETIEELCDEFVVVHNTEFYNGKDIYYLDCSKAHLRGDCYYDFTFEQMKTGRINIGGTLYGAIWTDKGLIYVAKLNEKGELELL